MKKLWAFLVAAMLLLGCTAMAADTFRFTAEELKTDKWDSAWASVRIQTADGGLQVGTGEGANYCLSAYENAAALHNKVIEFDAKITFVPSSPAMFLFRHEAVPSGVGDSMTYALTLTDANAVSFSRWAQLENTVLAEATLDADLTVFNNYKIGIINEGNNVHLTLYVNDVKIMDTVDENPGSAFLEAGAMMLQSGYNITTFRPLGAEAPVDTTPAPVDTTPAPVDTTPAPVDTTPAPADTTPKTGGLSLLAVLGAGVVLTGLVSKKRR